jgi:aspartyl-tRNA(Asn)/glutamyl-tRNA(Gln) amidotransferase subunit B
VNEQGLDLADLKLTPAALAELISLIESDTITGAAARQVFDQIVTSGEMPKTVVEALGLTQISDDDAIASIVQEVIAEHADAVESYRKGKENALKFLVGQVMRKTKGRANPQVVNDLLRKKLMEA